MSALKIVKKKTERPKNQNVIHEDLFTDNSPMSSNAAIDQNAKSYGSKLNGALLFGILGVLILGLGGYWFFNYKNSNNSKRPYAFIELKAIDQEGHPVAGAKVSYSNKKLGVTDSFGEWRRFMKVELGSTLSIKIEKKSIGLLAIRNFAVPFNIPVRGEIELSGNVQLQSYSEVKQQLSSVNSENMMLENKKEPSKLSQLAEELLNEKTEASIESNIKFLPERKGYQSISFVFMQTNRSGFNSYDKKSSRNLSKLVLPKLRSRSRELGLEVKNSSRWKVYIKHLPGSASGKSSGLVHVMASIPGSDQKVEFLKNYKGNPLITAKSILWGLKIHSAKDFSIVKDGNRWFVKKPAIEKGLWNLKPGTYLRGASGKKFQVSTPEKTLANGQIVLPLVVIDKKPCPGNKQSCYLFTSHVGIEPPAGSWRRLKLQIYGLPENSNVFASGYQAVHEGGKVWGYWGAYKSATNITIVNKGKLIFRKRIVNTSKKIPFINFPSKSYSRR